MTLNKFVAILKRVDWIIEITNNIRGHMQCAPTRNKKMWGKDNKSLIWREI